MARMDLTAFRFEWMQVSSRWFPLGDGEAGGGSVFLDILITKL
jgi:hypothetical protein